MTWGDAAERILRTEYRPLHYSTLAKKIVQKKLAETKGRVPARAFYSSLASDNNFRKRKGRPPRFKIVEGFVRLTEWRKKGKQGRGSPVYTEAQAEFQRVKAELVNKLRRLSGTELERYVEELLVRMGYDNVAHDKELDRQGIDLVCEMRQGINQIKTGVQVKNRQAGNPLGPKVVRYLRDVCRDFKCSQGVLITTGRFGRDAEAVANAPGREPIILIDGDKLAELAAEYEVGITSQPLKVYTIDEANPFLRSSSRRK